MDLKEYELDGRTYLFSLEDVPAGAKPVADKRPAEKRAPAPQNKQAPKAANKED